MYDRDRYVYEAFMGKWPEKVPHWEHWSDPDAETELTGIDYYDHPKLCRERMHELYPELEIGIPADDTPVPRPAGNDTANHTVRWGAGQTATFLHGEQFFKTPEDVFAFSPLKHADMRGWRHVVENFDFTSEETILERFKQSLGLGDTWGSAKPGVPSSAGFYNTTFMWPLLTFGWELFMECCLDDEFEPVMAEFAEINRRVFRVIAKLPVNFVVCHDDIVNTRGPVCSPEWMHKYVFPRYEEYWDILRSSGKEVIFMVDGCVDRYADDVFACGARGIISEPYTDYKAIARRHKDCFLAGEGDNRVLCRNDPAEIRRMVEKMAQTADICGGYMMCIGNHIPWNVPGESVKRYIELSRELVRRG